MFGFFCDVFNDNQAKLMVQYFDNNNLDEDELKSINESPSLYIGDTISGAMAHFHLYTKGHSIYKHTDSEVALENIGIANNEASEFREKVDTLLTNLDDATAIENTLLFPQWVVGKNYLVDEKVKYNNVLYKVLQAHTSQANWAPDVAVSLFARVLVEDEIHDWEQPDSTNPYMTGDKVRYNGNIYQSLIDNNIWSPAAYPAGWQLITEP